MKKTVVFILTVLMLLSISACSKEPSGKVSAEIKKCIYEGEVSAADLTQEDISGYVYVFESVLKAHPEKVYDTYEITLKVSNGLEYFIKGNDNHTGKYRENGSELTCKQALFSPNDFSDLKGALVFIPDTQKRFDDDDFSTLSYRMLVEKDCQITEPIYFNYYGRYKYEAQRCEVSGTQLISQAAAKKSA